MTKIIKNKNHKLIDRNLAGLCKSLDSEDASRAARIKRIMQRFANNNGYRQIHHSNIADLRHGDDVIFVLRHDAEFIIHLLTFESYSCGLFDFVEMQGVRESKAMGYGLFAVSPA